MLLKWFTRNCDNTQYLLKTDDDMYINLVKLYDIVQANKKPNLLLGSLICNAIPIKDPYNKWYVPSYMFSGKRYPNYLSGNWIPSRFPASLTLRFRHSLLDAQEHGEQALPGQPRHANLPPGGHLHHWDPLQQSQDQVGSAWEGSVSRVMYFRPSDNIGFSYIRRKLNSCLFKQTVSTHNIKLAEMKAIHDKLQSSKHQECPTIRARLMREYGPGKCNWPKNWELLMGSSNISCHNVTGHDIIIYCLCVAYYMLVKLYRFILQ